MADEKDSKHRERPTEEGEGAASGEKRWSVSDMMREVTLTGLATFFMTEDSVRNYLKEKKLPKELVSFFLDGVTKKKDDFYGMLAKEFGRVLSKIDLSREVSHFLERHKIHFEAKVSFEPKHVEKHLKENIKEHRKDTHE